MKHLMLTKPHNKNCDDLITIAEQELQAYFNAVKELFGSEHAHMSAEDWLNELEAVSRMPVSARDCRLITLKVARTLAGRLNITLGALV